jgi:tetratricopeptide (TPR) repeat protein
MGEHMEALAAHEKALEIRQHILPLNHLHVATCYNTIGLVYENTGEYSKALCCYKKDLEISEKLFLQSIPTWLHRTTA